MLLGSRDRRGADRARAARHRPDRPELRDRPGRDERAPALPGPARAGPAVRACPTPGCPMLGADGAHYPLTPGRAGRRARRVHPRVRARAGRRLLRHDARAPAPGRRARRAAASCAPRAARARAGRRLALPARAVPPGHRVPGDRRAHQRQRLQGVPRGDARRAAGTTASRSPATQIRDGAHLLDLCVDYVGRDGVADMRELAGRFATASTLPIVLDSTEPPVIEAGLEMLGGRAVVNSVNYEDGDGPDSRFARIMPIVARARRRRRRADHRRGGPGPHRRVEGRRRRAADRRPHRQLGHARSRTSSSTA